MGWDPFAPAAGFGERPFPKKVTLIDNKGTVTELTPNPNKFIKADMGKPMLSLIEPHFVTSLGDILTFGAQKYSIDNWKLCTDKQRYKDALLRHTYAYLSGEILDPESGIEHTACMAFNTMALQWFDNNLKGQENE